MDAAVERFKIPKTFKSLRDLDFFTSDLKLNYKGEAGYKTLSGGCITLVFYFLIVLSSLIYFMDYLDTSDPQISRKVYRAKQRTSFDIVEHRFHLFFFLKDGENFLSALEMQKFFDIEAELLTTKYHENGTVSSSDVLPLSTLPCNDSFWVTTDSYFQQELPSRNLDYLQKMAICSNGTSLVISGTFLDRSYTKLRYKLVPCSSSKSCHPPKMLQESLNHLFLHIGVVEGSLDLSK